jgi:CRP-like cAMP-binding protein
MVGPGQVLGEMALLDVAPRSATATVLAPVVALEIKNDHFDRLVEERNPGAVKLLHQLNRLLCQRLRAVTTRIESELSGAMEPPPPIPKSSRRVSAPSLELSVPSLPTPSRDSQPGVAESMRNSVATTVPTFEMARRGGVWKVLWGVKG